MSIRIFCSLVIGQDGHLPNTVLPRPPGYCLLFSPCTYLFSGSFCYIVCWGRGWTQGLNLLGKLSLTAESPEHNLFLVCCHTPLCSAFLLMVSELISIAMRLTHGTCFTEENFLLKVFIKCLLLTCWLGMGLLKTRFCLGTSKRTHYWGYMEDPKAKYLKVNGYHKSLDTEPEYS